MASQRKQKLNKESKSFKRAAKHPVSTLHLSRRAEAVNRTRTAREAHRDITFSFHKSHEALREQDVPKRSSSLLTQSHRHQRHSNLSRFCLHRRTLFFYPDLQSGWRKVWEIGIWFLWAWQTAECLCDVALSILDKLTSHNHSYLTICNRTKRFSQQYSISSNFNTVIHKLITWQETRLTQTWKINSIRISFSEHMVQMRSKK